MPMADILLSAAESYTSEAAASSNLSGDDRRPKSVKGTTPPPEHDLEGRTFAADHNYCDGCGILYSRGDAPFRSGPLLQSFWKQGQQITRMEHLHGEGYYSVHGHNLYDGLRAAIGSGE